MFYSVECLRVLQVGCCLPTRTGFSGCSTGSGTESDSDESVPELEEQDSAQTQQAQVRASELNFMFQFHVFTRAGGQR